jgi:hypothetical protein
MPPLEFRQYLHGLGLNHQNVSALVGVQDRTVRRWASGRIDIPEDVSSLLLELDASVTKAVSERLQNIDPRPDFFDAPASIKNALWDAIDRRTHEVESLIDVTWHIHRICSRRRTE